MNWYIRVNYNFIDFEPDFYKRAVAEGFLTCEWDGPSPQLGEAVGPLTATDGRGDKWQVSRAYISRVTTDGKVRVLARTSGPFHQIGFPQFVCQREPEPVPIIIDSPS